MTPHAWLDEFRKIGALWIRDAAKRGPHALLTSGKHSDGFFNASAIISRTSTLAAVVHQLIDDGGLREKNIGAVAGSALGGIPIAYEFGRSLACHRAIFTEKDDDGMLALKRFEVAPGERVLVVEDVLTSGKSTNETISSLESKGAAVMDCVCTIVNRSGKQTLGARAIHSLIDLDLQVWEADDCPLCREGSTPLRPKSNWDALTNPR